ncbi:MAG: aldolase [Clostridia bacterium BRH_c25]|nr:MAG: aldolase [Clostridia bacterium BRH_c25]
MSLDLMFITNDINIASEAEIAGVDRIFIDLEKNGKLERQGHLDTHIAEHYISDVKKIKNVLKKADLIVRINPLFQGTKEEVEKCIEYGADIIMLPMFKTKEEVARFIEYVNGRARVSLLLETAQAFIRVNQIVEIEGINEIHIGLNDLHLSLGLDFMFELLSEGIIDYLANIVKGKGIKFGFGGIARIGEGVIPAELVIGEHYRLGSEVAILSRTFRNDASLNNKFNNTVNIREEVEKLRSYEHYLLKQDDSFFVENSFNFRSLVRKYVTNLNKK